MKIFKNHEMKEHSNMKIGGISKNFFVAESRDEVKDILDNYSNIFVIGNGTNTLIKDGEIETNFLSLKKFDNIVEIEKNIIKAEAGADFSAVIEYTKERNYSGLENLIGIPGTLGGLVYMNGGAYGSEIFDHIISLEILDENHNIREVKKEDIEVSYRTTEIKMKKWVVLSATFRLEEGFNREKAEEIRVIREGKHPLEFPNLGSTFKNPEGKFAAKLIVEAGIQGYRIGDAQVSEKHPNFIINLGKATFNDIREIISYVKAEVERKTGIKLEEEIITINE